MSEKRRKIESRVIKCIEEYTEECEKSEVNKDELIDIINTLIGTEYNEQGDEISYFTEISNIVDEYFQK